jgi:hypothetical protein
MQRLVKCCLRAALSSAVLELPTKGSRAPRAVCGYGALVRRFTARRYSATAGDALNVWTVKMGSCSCAQFMPRAPFGAVNIVHKIALLHRALFYSASCSICWSINLRLPRAKLVTFWDTAPVSATAGDALKRCEYVPCIGRKCKSDKHEYWRCGFSAGSTR